MGDTCHYPCHNSWPQGWSWFLTSSKILETLTHMKGIKPTWRSKPCSKESALADSGRAMFSSGFPQFRPRSSLLTSWKILNERSKKLQNVYRREKNSLYRDKEQWKDWKKIRNNNKINPISTKTKFVKATFIS